MALFYNDQLGPFNGFTQVKGSSTDVKRTHTKLIVSEGAVPAEKWLVDPRLKRLFKYQFGGTGSVVIPKGRIVALATNGGPNDDGVFIGYSSRKKFNALTIANGGKDVQDIDKDGNAYVRKANVAIGVAPTNIFEQLADDTADVLPLIIRSDVYIEVPYFTNKEDAEAVHWGSAYGILRAGDLVCSDENGRFVKFEVYPTKSETLNASADANGQAVVHVGLPIKPQTNVTVVNAANETVNVDEVVFASGEIHLSGLTASEVTQVTVTYISAIPNDPTHVVGQVYAVDTNLPPEGWLQWAEWGLTDQQLMFDYDRTGFRPEDMTDNGYPFDPAYVDALAKMMGPQGKGIPGLTNGSNIETTITDEVIGNIQPNIAAGTVHNFRLLHVPAVEGSLEVKINGVVVTPEYVDYTSGLVIIKTPQSYSMAVPVTASYKATGQIPGLPTNWDYKGSIGAVRIMLKL
ncbi:hypothetical protein MTAT_20420 [Moorella thermoacetica]|uniref:Uncharacterized protein n=1 Tax=Neomoorella thermoacetica TaxID=1525 RepID=A0AAC9HIQ6_NEOTH|nr:hypothetical protein [Moorella thermoacetica]AOQ24697.1 hypothetical protein Maut_02269 [Moorella thermoacetica]TYL12800.1 hypothetical protein MTAT_20420 [Moorella thermoacetica]